jgi:hypothetical protein
MSIYSKFHIFEEVSNQRNLDEKIQFFYIPFTLAFKKLESNEIYYSINAIEEFMSISRKSNGSFEKTSEITKK